jgi:DNA-binding transcriptional LysR family regulator
LDIEGLRLKEISLFLDLVKTGSIRELARQRGDQPGQISKSIRGLEAKLGSPLIHRSTQGVTLTAYATEILAYLEGIRNFQERLAGHLGTAKNQTVLSVATTSFFSSGFVPSILGEFEKFAPEVHCRLIELPPNQFISVALRNGFEVCIHLRDLDWPKTWSSTEVGRIQWQLCAREGHPLSRKPTLKNVLEYPFVYPIYWTHEGIRHGDDNFPVPIRKRVKGYETATATSAAQVVAQTDHIGFLPNLVTRPLIQQGAIKVIDVPGVKEVGQSVFLTVKSDAVKQKRFVWLKERCQRLLAER